MDENEEDLAFLNNDNNTPLKTQTYTPKFFDIPTSNIETTNNAIDSEDTS